MFRGVLAIVTSMLPGNLLAEELLPLKEQWAITDTDYVIDARCAAVNIWQAQIAKDAGSNMFEKHFQNSVFFIQMAVPKRAETEKIPINEAEILTKADIKRYRNNYLIQFAEIKKDTTKSGQLKFLQYISDTDFCVQRGRLYANGKP